MKTATYKVVDLFGNEEVRFVEQQNSKPSLFGRYDEFVDKFKAKKTTDDCFTPPDVFDLVLKHVIEKCDINGLEIIRPFYPGGDFESIKYPPRCVVIDNPPFSIISKIARFYIKHKVKFFLFAPHLTLFGSDIDCTHIVASVSIEYENGAKVKTSFLSNMFGDAKVIGDSELYEKFNLLAESKKRNLPKYKYPDNVLTVSHVAFMVEKGISFMLKKHHTMHCRGLEDQKSHNKAIFGGGFLLSEKAAAEKAAAEKAAAEKAAAEKDIVIEWRLSEKELSIIRNLG